MNYKDYLDEKMGEIDIKKDEYDIVVQALAKAVVNNEQNLQKYVQKSIIQSGNGLDIAKELAKIAAEDSKVFNTVMNIDDLWEFDSADVIKVIDELNKI